MEESNDVQELQVIDGVFVDSIETNSVPNFEEPDLKEQEVIEIEQEGGK